MKKHLARKSWVGVGVVSLMLALSACGGGGSQGGDGSSGGESPTSGGSTGGGTGTGGDGGSAQAATLQVAVSGSGAVSSNPEGVNCSTQCTQSFAVGAQVTLSATPAPGATFVGWSGACTGSSATCTVDLDQSAVVSAVFATAGAPTKSACSDFYDGAFSFVSGSALSAVPSLAKPVKGRAFPEPTYKTCVTRVTNHAVEPPAGFARNDYSRRQAFNADSSKLLVYALDGFWHVYDARTLAHIKRLTGPAGDAEPQWHSSDPNLLYYLPSNGIGMKLYELNVATDQSRVIGDFAARLKARWPTAMASWTKSEGSPSADGRYWCFMVDGDGWNSVGVFTWDRDTNTITGMRDTNGNRPDHLSMSPSGNYCVVSSDDASGTVAFSRDFSQQRKVHHKSEHSDIALDENGDDVYVAIDYQSNAGDVFMVNLRTGVKTVLFPTYLSGTATALHVSGKAYNKRGWVVISTYADGGGSLQWMHRKVMAVQLKADPTIYHLAHHHSSPAGYWTEPHASVNRDFTKILFNSNWDLASEDIDTYMIELPASWN